MVATGLGSLASQLGLTPSEYTLFERRLERQPNHAELMMCAAMWSEHCSYKSTRALLATLPRAHPLVLAGPGASAGVIDVGDGWAVAFKMESHNHPSAIEPYQGAATGVGGILRDVVAQGGRPWAIMDSLCFAPDDRFTQAGVVSGIAGYGNAYGVANLGGRTVYDERYAQNPLVNAMAVGLLRHEELRTSAASRVGDLLILVGARTGRDGILGAAFASEPIVESGRDRSRSRSHVQVGDPFTGRRLMEALSSLQIPITACQDLGAAGLTCALCEMAAAGGVGVRVQLRDVPQREPEMAPSEILVSESQERFLLAVEPEHVQAVLSHFECQGVRAAVIGETTADNYVTALFGEEIVAHVSAKLLVEGVPPRMWQRANPLPPRVFERGGGLGWGAGAPTSMILNHLLAHPELQSREAIYNRYDQTVGNKTIRGPGQADAAVMRLPNDRALALTVTGRGRHSAKDAYLGAQHALVEALRDLATVGAPLFAITDCLNMGDPSDPVQFAQLDDTIRGLADGLRALDAVVTGGNVSLYNTTGGVPTPPTPPTPMLGAVGIIDNPSHIAPNKVSEGDELWLIGRTDHQPTFSLYGGDTGALLPPDLAFEAQVAAFVRVGSFLAVKAAGLGGWLVALAKLCRRLGCGAMLEGEVESPWSYFGETHANYLVVVPPSPAARPHAAGIPARRIGVIAASKLTLPDGVVCHVDA